MTQEDPITILGEHTTMVNRDSHSEEDKRNQAMIRPTCPRTDKSIGNFSTHHLHPECYIIHHPSIQTETKWSKECPSKRWMKMIYTIWHHRNSNTVSQIPTNIHLCLYYISLPQRLSHINDTTVHTHNWLCQSSYDQQIVTWYTASRRTDTLRYIKSQLLSIIHLPISLDGILHFYQHICQ